MSARRQRTKKPGTFLSDKAVEYILTRSVEDLAQLTEEKVAQHLQVDVVNLVKTFEVNHHVPLNLFIRREKIYRAVFLLEKEPALSIDELSGKLGFGRTDDFVSAFKSYMAIDPHRYQELKIGRPGLD